MDAFSGTLGELLGIKPPGVSGSRIRKLREFAHSHLSDAPEIVDRVCTHVRTSPTTHKLGALYVVDALVRAYDEEEKRSGDENARRGHELFKNALPQLMEDAAIRQQSSDVFEKMHKLLDIWRRAGTYSDSQLDEIEDKYFKQPRSQTPPGSPPSRLGGLPPTPPAQKAPDTNQVLSILQNLAKSKAPTTASVSSEQPAPPQAQADSQNPPQQGGSFLEMLMAQSKGERGRTATPTGGRDSSRSPSRQEGGTSRIGSAAHNLKHDPALLPDRIRVFSRTLYVGSIPDGMPEEELKAILEQYVPVQSIIYHREKRHAFVKVFTRTDAESIKKSFEQRNRDGIPPLLRVRWGVGFGPRDCCDYQKGVSVIPIVRLTDADVRWVKTAEYGGTGGQSLEGGQVMEEPDIEIGSGVSSKAMSKRTVAPPTPAMPGVPPAAGGMPMMGMPGMGMPFPMMPMANAPGSQMPFPMMMPGMPGMPAMPPNTDMQSLFSQMAQSQQGQQQPQSGSGERTQDPRRVS